MTPEQQTQYIQQQRSQGVPDNQILQFVQAQSAPAPQRTGVGEFLPSIFAAAGGILGGIGGSALGPAGTVAVGIGGATAGGALGETIQQKIETGFGLRDKINTGQIAASGAISGLTQAAGGIVFKALGFGAKVSRPVLARWAGKLSGYDDKVVEEALKRSSGVLEGARKGEVALRDIVVRVANKISTLAKDTLRESRLLIKDFANQSRIEGQGARSELLKVSSNYFNQTVSSLRGKYNIGVDKAGQLLFDRGSKLSNIISGGDRSAIQIGFNALNSIAKNPTIQHIDSVLERLIVLRTKTPVGSPTGAETRAIIGEMAENVMGFVKSVPPAFGRGWSAYSKYLEDTVVKRVMINDAKELFGGSANLSPKQISIIEKRLLRLFNTGELEIREFAKKVGGEIKEDIVGTTAGALVETGRSAGGLAGAISQGSRGIIQKVVESVPRSLVRSYIKTGEITDEIRNLPVIKQAIQITGLSIKVIMQEIANLSADKTTR